MRKPMLHTLLALNALNALSTEIHIAVSMRKASAFAKSTTRAISADIRNLRIQLRHTDPYNAAIHVPTHNMFTASNVRNFITGLFP